MISDAIAQLVGTLLRKNRIAFDKDELSFQLQGHPAYPSLHSITGALDHFNISNIAATVPVAESSLDHLPKTFMAQLGQGMAVVSRVSTGFKVLGDQYKSRTLDQEAFLAEFTGVVVAVEQEDEQSTGFDKFSLGWIILAVLSLGLVLTQTSAVTGLFPLLLLSLGWLVSYTIQKQEKGESSAIGNAFCGDTVQAQGCGAVLNSKGATVFGGLKISDLSIIYFAALTIYGLVFSGNTATTAVLNYAAILALPVTAYSLIYQAWVVKKWCALCLTIVGILWLNAAYVLLQSGLGALPTLPAILSFTLTGAATVVAWYWLKQKLDRLNKAELTNLEYLKFRRNYKLLDALYAQENQVHTAPLEREIVMGNENAPLQLTIISNPYCIHCKEVHTYVERILEQHKNNIGINIRLNVKLRNTESDQVNVSTRLLELYEQQGADLCLEAMHDIYSDNDFEQWNEKWGAVEAKDDYLQVLENSKAWCKEHQMNFTPEILINGRTFPVEYPREDLPFSIDELFENNAQ